MTRFLQRPAVKAALVSFVLLLAAALPALCLLPDLTQAQTASPYRQ